MDTFAKRVKRRRKELGLTQGKLAELSGLKQPDISKIELGQIKQTVEIVGLAEALKCNAHWLQTGDGDLSSGINEFEVMLSHMAAVLRMIPEADREAAIAKALQALVTHLPGYRIPSSAAPLLLGRSKIPS